MNMKKISRKLVMSIASMAFAVVALGTTTFAWFTMNSTATANLTVNVQGGSDGILLSTDGVNYNSTVDVEVAPDFRLQPVTYNYTKEAGTATAIGDFQKMTESGLEAASSGMILEFDLYALTSGTNTNVYFNIASANTVTTQDDTVESYTLLSSFNCDNGNFSAGTSIKLSAVNALRSVVDVYSEPKERSLVASMAKENNDVSSVPFGTAKRITPMFGFTENTIGGATAKTEIQTSDADNSSYNFGQSLALTNAANAYLTSLNADTFNDTTAPEDPTLVDGFAAYTSPIYTCENANYVTKLTFRFWLEGFDADCMDAIMGQAIDIKLGFTTTERTSA